MAGTLRIKFFATSSKESNIIVTLTKVGMIAAVPRKNDNGVGYKSYLGLSECGNILNGLLSLGPDAILA